MKGSGASGGAVTVVNAIATGRGAAIGVGLATRARVEILPEGRGVTLEARLPAGEPAEKDPALARECLAALAAHSRGRTPFPAPCGLHVSTVSDIPVSRGLKSSSAAANAIVAALADAAGLPLPPLEVALLAAEASVRAGVSITGAFDDGCASLLGGLAVTDNRERRLLAHRPVEDLAVLLVVPPRRIPKSEAARRPVGAIAPLVAEAHGWALDGRWPQALVANGLAYSAAYGLSAGCALAALEAGALAAGLTGTGPAVAVLSRDAKAREAFAAARTAAPSGSAFLETRTRNGAVEARQ